MILCFLQVYFSIIYILHLIRYGNDFQFSFLKCTNIIIAFNNI